MIINPYYGLIIVIITTIFLFKIRKKNDLLTDLKRLKPWGTKNDFNVKDWGAYTKTAIKFQKASKDEVLRTLGRFMKFSKNANQENYEEDSKPFILMRVIFDLPQEIAVEERKSFKGWINWPLEDSNGNVDYSWPIQWDNGVPMFVSSYEGSEGKLYEAILEYEYLLNHYPFRNFE